MSLTKESFGIAVTTLTHWWAPTVVRISGDDSVAGELLQAGDGRVECRFPDRLIMIANHQVCFMKVNRTLLTPIDILGLVISVVGCIYEPASYAWAYLHYLERISETHTDRWLGHAILWLCFHGPENGNRPTKISTSNAGLKAGSFRTYVWLPRS